MKIDNLGYINSASLFSKNPCSIVTIILDENEKSILNKNENHIKTKIGKLVDNIFLESDLFLLNLAKFFIDDILKTNESMISESKIVKIDDNKYYLVIEDINSHLTYFLVNSIMQILIQLFNTMNFDELLSKIDNLSSVIKKNSKSTFSKIVETIMIKNGIDYIPQITNSPSEIQIGFGKYQNIVDGSKTFNSSFHGVNISLSKIQTNYFLSQYAFPITKQHQIKNTNEALIYAKKLGYPVVLKSEYGAFGSRVYTDLKTEEQVINAFNIIQNDIIKNKLNGKNILIEEFVEGNDYRILVANNKVVTVYCRIPAQIIGDGKNSIQKLIELENNQRKIKNSQQNYGSIPLLKITDHEVFMLKKQNLEIDFIPQKNQIVLLRSNANQSSGGEIEVVTDKIHPDNIKLAIEVSKVMKIDIIGIDVMIDNISNSYKEGKLKILEVNHSPAIRHWAFKDGEYEKNLIEILAPKYNNENFPIIVIVKNNYSQDITTSLNNFFIQNSFKVGMINKSGMYINNELYSLSKDINYDNPALHLLRNPNINLAIVERDINSILDFGIGTGNCTMSILLDCSDKIVKTKFYEEGISQIEATKLLLENSKDISIVLIDNLILCDLSKKVSKDKVILLATNKNNKELNYFIQNDYNIILLNKIDDSKIEFFVNYKGEKKNFSIKLEKQNQEIILSVMTQVALNLKFGGIL